MKTVLRIVLVVAILASGWLILRLTGLDEILTFENLVRERDQLLETVEQSPGLWALGFIAANYIAIALSFPGATLFTLSAGLLFGPFLGAILVNISATLGAFTVFLLTRTVLGKGFQEKYEKKLQTFNRAFERDGASYLLSLRLIPAFPFFLINILAGLTSVKPRTFLWTTSVGIFAGSLVYAYAGSSLGTISSPGEIFSLEVILAFTALGLFSLIPVIHKHIVARRKAKQEGGKSQATPESEEV